MAIFLAGSAFGIEQHLQPHGIAEVTVPDLVGSIHQAQQLFLGGG